MRDIVKVSPRQIILLLVISRLSTAFTYLPAVATPPANQDVWIAELLGIVYGFIICGPLIFLSNRFENMTLFEYMEKVMGKFLGKLLGLLLAAELVFLSLTQLPLLNNFLRAVVMPETPDFPIMLFMLAVCVYAGYKGPESLGRLAEILAPLIFAIIILFTLLNIKNMELEILLPVVADSSLLDLHIGALNVVSRHTEIIALAMLAPCIDRKGEIKRIVVYYITLCTFFFLLITISVQTVLGFELTAKMNFPYFIYARTIDVFDVIERIESISAVAWFFGVFLKYSLFLYLAATGMAQVFGVNSYKAFIIPVALLNLLISLKSPIGKFEVMSRILSYKVTPFFTLPGMLIIPMLVTVIYFIRRKSLSQYR
jgi:spore germination protein KB